MPFMFSPCKPCCDQPVPDVACCIFPPCYVLPTRDVYLTDDSGTYAMIYDTETNSFLAAGYEFLCNDDQIEPYSLIHGQEQVTGAQATDRKRIEFTLGDGSMVYITLTPDPSGPCECVECVGPCEAKWPEVLYITDQHGTHPLAWNGGVGWTGCYTFAAESSDLGCNISSGQVMVRYGINCPTFPPCDEVALFIDYEIKDCVFELGSYYLSNYMACGDTVNRNWTETSTVYTTRPLYAEWNFPPDRLEFGTTHSPLPVSGLIILGE